MNKNFLLATATLTGGIIGGGIFAVPFVVSKSGFLSFVVYLVVLTLVQILLHLIFAEIILSNKENHRIPGYARMYAGKKAKLFTLIISLVGRHGAILAYILLGGTFLYTLLSPIFGFNLFFYATILFIVEIIIIFFGLKTISKAELALSLLLLLLMILISIKSYEFFNITNLQLVNMKYLLLPYGPVFFAVAGQTAIPEVCRLLKNSKKKIKASILWGTLIPAVFTLIFAFVVTGVTGTQTTSDALTGLQNFLDNGVITFALIFGLLCVITSFLINAQALRETYWWDLKVNKNLAWLLAAFIPFGIYLLGLTNITKTISLTGSIIGGLMGIILIYLLFQAKKQRNYIPVINLKIKKIWAIILSVFFLLSLLYELYYAFIL